MMPIHIGKVEFRWDTLMNTALICMTLIVGFSVLNKRLKMNAVATQALLEKFSAIETEDAAAERTRGTVALRLAVIEQQHLQMLKEEKECTAIIEGLAKKLHLHLEPQQ